MTDPLSVTASITGIISLGLTVSSGLIKFVQSARDAPQDLETIANDMFALCGILDQFKGLITPGGGHLNPTLAADAAKNCSTLFNSMKDELEKASKTMKFTTLSSGKVKLSLKERGKFFFRQDSLNKLKTDILQSKTTLMLAMVVADIKKREEAQRNQECEKSDAEQRLQMLATMQSLNKRLEDMKIQTQEKSPSIQSVKRIKHGINAYNSKDPGSPMPHTIALSNYESPAGSQGPNTNVQSVLTTGVAMNSFTPLIANPFISLNVQTPINSTREFINPPDPTPKISTEHPNLKTWTIRPDSKFFDQTGWLAHQIEESATLPMDNPENHMGQMGWRQLSPAEALKTLNTPQRDMISAHARQSGSELLSVEGYGSVRIATVFGNLELSLLRWTCRHAQAATLSPPGFGNIQTRYNGPLPPPPDIPSPQLPPDHTRPFHTAQLQMQRSVMPSPEDFLRIRASMDAPRQALGARIPSPPAMLQRKTSTGKQIGGRRGPGAPISWNRLAKDDGEENYETDDVVVDIEEAEALFVQLAAKWTLG